MADSKWFFKKGLWLGIVLVIIHKLFCIFLAPDYLNDSYYYYVVGISFGMFILFFLITEKAGNLFITGFTGLFVLIGIEVLLGGTGLENRFFDFSMAWLETYFYGFIGSMIGTVIALVLTLMKFKFGLKFKRKEYIMEKTMKMKLLLYALISAFGFAYLILPENAGVSVPVFAVLQFALLWFVVPNRKRLWFFVPIFILSLNSFISGNGIWRVPNVIVSIVLYSAMFIDFDIKDTTSRFLMDILENIIEPVRHFNLPYKWALSANKEKAPTIKRVLIALAITLPCLVILVVTLSFADMVFSKGVSGFFTEIFRYINFNVVFKVLYGAAVGLYLFGLIYSSYLKKDKGNINTKAKQGDLIILNVLLASILVIYTIFVVIQFKYLFAEASLPFGLTYTEYARKGFFELFTLTGVNISLILMTVYLTKNMQSLWGRITKWLCVYLCGITIVLLASSFYRMGLYSIADGLTRLRLLVFGFLIFEVVGLLFTFFYILKPKFNIIMIYLSIALVYYMAINLVPIDAIIAKNQVERYLKLDATGIEYILTLSSDAAPQIARLMEEDGVDGVTKARTQQYFENTEHYYGSFVPRWQRMNLSVDRARKQSMTIKAGD